MGWLRQSDNRSHTPPFGMAALLAAGLSGAVCATAAEPAQGSLRTMSDADLRQVAAQGFGDPLQVQADRLFSGVSKYMAGGNAVEILGDLARLLNPPFSALLEAIGADQSFRSVTFNPASPDSLTGFDGTSFIRRPSTIGELSYRHIRVAGGHGGADFGDVEIRNIEMNGTRIIVKRRN